jgi:hypothetical protein
MRRCGKAICRPANFGRQGGSNPQRGGVVDLDHWLRTGDVGSLILGDRRRRSQRSQRRRRATASCTRLRQGEAEGRWPAERWGAVPRLRMRCAVPVTYASRPSYRGSPPVLEGAPKHQPWSAFRRAAARQSQADVGEHSQRPGECRMVANRFSSSHFEIARHRRGAQLRHRLAESQTVAYNSKSTPAA